MEVLITSKTKWGNRYCIGGLELDTDKYVRLMESVGFYQPSDSPFKIGEIWDLEYYRCPDIKPHIEDVKITKCNGLVKKMLNPDFINYINQKCLVWHGDFNTLFGGLLKWTNSGSGYLNDPEKLPKNSVGFWISDRDLNNKKINEKDYYVYLGTNKRLPYKGCIPPTQTILAGTILRVSLAKWFKGGHNGRDESRCYLQLSGWVTKNFS